MNVTAVQKFQQNLGFCGQESRILAIYETDLTINRHGVEEDELTGLLRKKSFLDRVLFSAFVGGGSWSALGVIDLGKFKRVNDTFGHLAGDVLLRHLARIIQNSICIGEHDYVARMGGDEFCFYLQGLAHPGMERQVISRLDQAVAAENWAAVVPGMKMRLVVNLGLVRFRTDRISVDRAIAAADHLMYQTKNLPKEKGVLAKYGHFNGQGELFVEESPLESAA